MTDAMERELRRLYGYPEDMTYEQYAESKRSEAMSLLESGKAEEAVDVLVKLCDSVKGDPESGLILGDIYREGRHVPKDPWMSMLYYCTSMTDRGDEACNVIWDRLSSFRTTLLMSRPMGKLVLNPQDAESACCSTMREYLCKGNVSVSNVDPDPKECTFSMTIDKKDYKRYIGKEKHEMSGSPDPGCVTPMDLTRCPFCKSPLVIRERRSTEWDMFVHEGF